MSNEQSNTGVFTADEMERVSKYLIGSQIRPYPIIIVPQTNGTAKIRQKEELMMENLMLSCPFKGVMSFVIGGAMGGFLGLFSSSVNPTHLDPAIKQMTTKETLIDMRNTIGSSAKNFAVIGLM